MKSRQVSWSALGSPISFQKSFRISPDQRSGRGVPLNTLFTRKGPSPTLTEKRQSARSARQTDNLAQNSSRQRMTPLQDLEIKKFPRHKSALWKTYRAAERNQAATRSSSRIDAVDQSWKRRLISRGNAIASRIWSSLQTQETSRSRPIPNPEWGTLPYFRRSRYHP